MVFTRHAVERYMQFHMLDRPLATEVEARAILEQHAGSATKVPHRTHRGDLIWNIEALGIEVIAKRDGDDDVVVTVLPPPQFRGLSPLQAEAVAARAAVVEAEIRAIEIEQRSPEAAPPPKYAGKTSPADREANEKRMAHIRALRERNVAAAYEHALLMSTFKTIRTQLSAERNLANLKQALRVALRHLRAAGQADALAAIGEVHAGFLLDDFIDGGKP